MGTKAILTGACMRHRPYLHGECVRRFGCSEDAPGLIERGTFSKVASAECNRGQLE